MKHSRAIIAACAALALGAPALAQNSPLSGLSPRGTVQGTDLIPIMPAGGPQLEQTTVVSLSSVLGASGGGLISSVTLTVPAYSCADTGSGAVTITCTASTQSANTVYAGPTSGSAAAPTFRALVAADITAAVQGATGTPIGTGGTLYVNASTGSDSNNCLASGAACLTIAHALSLIPPVSDGTVYTVNIADGTYAEGLCLTYPYTGGWAPAYPTVVIVGDDTTPANVVLTGSCSSNTASLLTIGTLTATVEGITFNPTVAVSYGNLAGDNVKVFLSNVTFENMGFGIGAFHQARIALAGSITISNFTSYGIWASSSVDIANDGNLTLVMTASGAAIQCFHADTQAAIQAGSASDVGHSWTGSISCPGGAGHGTVAQFAHADTNSSVELLFATTAQNASTPAGSRLGEAWRLGQIGLDGGTTASDFTNQCFTSDNGVVDSSNGRTFTSVGASSTGNGGVCDFY